MGDYERLRGNLNATLASLAHLEIGENVIEINDSLRCTAGGYGDVYRATLKGPSNSTTRLVAVKELRAVGDDITRIRIAIRLARELRIWERLRHPNVLELIGYQLSPQTTTARFISPFMTNGNIDEYLDNTSSSATDSLRTKLLTDVLNGLVYLHSLSPPICHADIKPGNVLITDRVEAVLCDFGLARLVDGQPSGLTTTKTTKGSIRYMSPELLDEDPRHTLHSDIWAYGCLVLKVMTGSLPYSSARSDQQVLLALAFKRPPASPPDLKLQDEMLKMLLTRCWDINPSERPPASTCLSYLTKPIPDESTGVKPPPKSAERIRADNEARENEQAKPEWHRSPVPVASTPTPIEQTSAAAPASLTIAVSPAANSTAANGTTSIAVTTTTGSSSQFTMATLTDLDLEQVPPELKKEGSDWFAIFNPQAQRKLDISLTLSLAHESVVCCVRFSPDGKLLATGCNRTAQIYDTKTGAKICTLSDNTVPKNGDMYIRDVCFSPDGKILVTGAEDKLIRIWDIASRTIRQVFSGHHQEVYYLAISRDGRVIVSGSGDRTARVWDLETGTHQTISILGVGDVNPGVASVAISPDGQLVAVGSFDAIVRIWDVTTGNLIERLRGHLDSVWSVAFTPDGKGLVSGSLDKTVKYWDLSPLLRSPNRTQDLSQSESVPSGHQAVTIEGGEKGGTCSVTFSGHQDYVISVAVSPDGAWVVSGSKDRGVQFWDPRTGLTQLMLQGHKSAVISIDLSPVASPSGGLLASGSGDMIVRVWSYTSIP